MDHCWLISKSRACRSQQKPFRWHFSTEPSKSLLNFIFFPRRHLRLFVSLSCKISEMLGCPHSSWWPSWRCTVFIALTGHISYACFSSERPNAAFCINYHVTLSAVALVGPFYLLWKLNYIKRFGFLSQALLLTNWPPVQFSCWM